jgi:methionyl-tRNA synthetase
MKEKFYITTTLPYVNAEPHIGFALEIVQADVIARHHQLAGEEVFFNTGTDEHGQKIYEAIQKAGQSPEEYTDEYAAKFDALKKALNLSYNSFIRTTDPHHLKTAQEFWTRCAKNGDIYKKDYRVKYCVGCELAKTDSELESGKCPIHPNLELEDREEENYFFRFSAYQDKLLKFYENNPDFVVPEKRFNEIKAFVKSGLNDFSISRLKDKMPWGVSVPGDDEHVMYVWFDALVNYISCLGWPKDEKKFKAFWPGVQVAGKDNVRQQSAMWQAMLFSAGLPNSKQIMIHGFISHAGQKMSKSLGNVVNPLELVAQYGTDAVRYYLLKYVQPFEDSDFSIESFEEVYNADLANGLGNLVSRTANMIEKNGGKIKNLKSKEPNKLKIKNQEIDEYRFDLALKEINNQITEADQLIDKEKPWELAKSDPAKAAEILSEVAGRIINIALELKPFLPETADKIEKIFTAKKIKKPIEPLFKRIV